MGDPGRTKFFPHEKHHQTLYLLYRTHTIPESQLSVLPNKYPCRLSSSNTHHDSYIAWNQLIFISIYSSRENFPSHISHFPFYPLRSATTIPYTLLDATNYNFVKRAPLYLCTMQRYIRTGAYVARSLT